MLNILHHSIQGYHRQTTGALLTSNTNEITFLFESGWCMCERAKNALYPPSER